jgi:succinyl-diaminopimelate desuccinylase
MTGREGAATAGFLEAAREDYPAVVELTRELVRIPSRGGTDSYDPVLSRMAAWLAARWTIRAGSCTASSPSR